MCLCKLLLSKHYHNPETDDILENWPKVTREIDFYNECYLILFSVCFINRILNIGLWGYMSESDFKILIRIKMVPTN